MRNVFIGILTIIIFLLIFSLHDSKNYEFYDLKGNRGTSSICETTINGVECLVNKEMKIVRQFSKIGE